MEITIGDKVYTIRRLTALDVASVRNSAFEMSGDKGNPGMKFNVGSSQLETCKRGVVKITEGEKVIENKREVDRIIEGLYEDEYSELFIAIDDLNHPTGQEVKN